MGNPHNLLIASSPHIREGSTTAKIMWSVVICLIPAGLWSAYVFGMYSLLVVAASIASAVLTEYVITRVQGRLTVADGSAFLTGLLIGYNMPPTIPLFIPCVASVFAIAVVKQSFGGLGRNWMNPALAGRAFVMFSWTGPMTTWLMPRAAGSADAVTGASPLGFVKSGLLESGGAAGGPAGLLSRLGYDGYGTAVASWLQAHIYPNGLPFDETYVHLFFGNTPGCVGEVSAFLLILGALYLFVKKTITWEIPVTYIGTFGLLAWAFGGLQYGSGFFSGDVVFSIFSGGLMLGALYMATDMVTTPLAPKGMVIFGVGAGFLTFLIRFYGSFPEGVSLAILLMNMTVPLIDRVTKSVRFGLVKEGAS